MSAPNEKAEYASTYHRDGTISYWDVYTQSWRRSAHITDRDLATLSSTERARTIKHLGLS